MKWLPIALLWSALAMSTAVAATQPVVPAAKRTAAKSAAHGVLPTIADDYPRALALARASKVPIFIEAWAPW